MTNSLVLKNARIISVDKIINYGWLEIKDKKIIAINEGQYPNGEDNSKVIDCQQKTIIPGFIDLHVHGGYGYDFMNQTQPLSQIIDSFAKTVVQEGVTKFCLGTVSSAKKTLDQFFLALGQFMKVKQKENQAQVIGAYLEGPFISHFFKGAHQDSLLVTPNIMWVKEWKKISNNSLKVVTFAPELDKNLDSDNSFTCELNKLNIVGSLAHSAASFNEVKVAVQRGLQHVSHLYNGMSAFHHRFPGCVPAILDSNELLVELICDGVHIDFDILKLTYKIITADRICMITDAMVAKGCPNGNYFLGSLPVVKQENMVKLQNSDLLAGSVARMIDGFKTWLKITDNNWQDCIKISAYNAAKQLKISDTTGDIAVNKLADIVILDNDNDVYITICEGKIAFQR